MHNGARSNEIVQIVQVRWPPTPVSTFLGVDDQTFQKCCKVYNRHRVWSLAGRTHVTDTAQCVWPWGLASWLLEWSRKLWAGSEKNQL